MSLFSHMQKSGFLITRLICHHARSENMVGLLTTGCLLSTGDQYTKLHYRSMRILYMLYFQQPPSVQKTVPAPAPQAQANGGDFLSMNLSAKEMRERLQAKKKQDPKTKAGMDFRSKYEIFQKM